MEARIIKLAPESSISRVATFEEAFGEFSEAGGRGRARRQRRRMERIENRAERRSARRTHRQEAKEERLQGRIQRRGERAEARAERKKLRHPDEEPTNNPQEQGGGGSGTEQAPPSSEGQGGGSALPPDQAPQGGGGYADQQGGGQEQGGGSGSESQGGGYADQQGDSDSEGDSESDNAGDQSDEQGNDSEGNEDYGFDGIISAEDRFGDVAGDDNIQRISVHPAVQDMANKYEWNKELACRLIMKRNDANNSGMATQGLTDQIEERKNRMAEIKQHFDNYLNFDADFSECCGCSGADGSGNFKKAHPKLKRKRSMEVKKALETSRSNRMSVKGGSAMDKLRQADKIRHYGGDVVPVEEGLNPEFSQNQIVVPSEIKSNFTGLNGIDNADDFDAPATREVFLNADGEGQGAFIGVGSLLLGVGITIGILYLVDKYKVIK